MTRHMRLSTPTSPSLVSSLESAASMLIWLAMVRVTLLAMLSLSLEVGGVISEPRSVSVEGVSLLAASLTEVEAMLEGPDDESMDNTAKSETKLRFLPRETCLQQEAVDDREKKWITL
ncbi:hypothetical protein LZ32DRAFT_655392 [Colletotrichum eremochloae]|nr:hypothetical protein LZ32DRAFT_655392 [Colletotrichum eremochloae]